MSTSPSPSPHIVAWIGLDWADETHAVCLQAAGSADLESSALIGMRSSAAGAGTFINLETLFFGGCETCGEGLRSPAKETPGPATNFRPDRSTITQRASSGAGRLDRQRILRCRPARTLL